VFISISSLPRFGSRKETVVNGQRAREFNITRILRQRTRSSTCIRSRRVLVVRAKRDKDL